MTSNGTRPQPKARKAVAMPSRPGSLSSLQLKLWRALVHAERLYQEAPSTELEKQIRTLNSFSQLCMAYLKSIGAHTYNTHPVVGQDRET
jgi:hypothetical protein